MIDGYETHVNYIPGNPGISGCSGHSGTPGFRSADKSILEKFKYRFNVILIYGPLRYEIEDKFDGQSYHMILNTNQNFSTDAIGKDLELFLNNIIISVSEEKLNKILET